MISLIEIIFLAITLYYTSAHIWNMAMCIKSKKNMPDKGIVIEILVCLLWAVYIVMF